MAADLDSSSTIRQSLVRLGHLEFEDFLLLPPPVLRLASCESHLRSDWSLALANAPHVLSHFRRSANLQSAICNLQSPRTLDDVRAAQSDLVHAFALELLKTKAPPLYDALPWNDWDFSVVEKRFRLWRTRFLLAGDGTTLTVCRCDKSAGVYVVEPEEPVARYIERKAALEKVRRFRVLGSSLSPSFLLPSASVDLAIIGPLPLLQTADCKLVIRELLRVSASVLLTENNPLSPPLDTDLLTSFGFSRDVVQVRGLGPRPCWWHPN
jgi:hypothetical protein